MITLRCTGFAGCATPPSPGLYLDRKPICASCHKQITESRVRPEECESCGWVTRKLVAYSGDRMNETNGRKKRWLCAVCAGTYVGNASLALTDDVSLQRTIALATNMVLARLERLERLLLPKKKGRK